MDKWRGYTLRRSPAADAEASPAQPSLPLPAPCVQARQPADGEHGHSRALGGPRLSQQQQHLRRRQAEGARETGRLGSATATGTVDPGAKRDDWLSHALLGIAVLWTSRNYDRALEEVERAIALNPSAVIAYQFLGCVAVFAGRATQALPALETVSATAPTCLRPCSATSSIALENTSPPFATRALFTSRWLMAHSFAAPTVALSCLPAASSRSSNGTNTSPWFHGAQSLSASAGVRSLASSAARVSHGRSACSGIGVSPDEPPWWPILWLKWCPVLSTCRKVRHAEMAEIGARQTGGSPRAGGLS